MPFQRFLGFASGLFALVAVPSVAAFSEPITYTTTIDGSQRSAMVESRPMDGVPYVSLIELVEQFGGGHTSLPTRVQIDLGGSTAWVRIDDTEVNAALSRFSLGQPLRREQRDVFIARSDIRNFFNRAFRVSVREGGETPPAQNRPAPRRQAENRVVLEDLMQPQEPSPVPMENLRLEEGRRRSIGTVLIDAGHGGFDPGAEGPDGLLEKDLTLAVAQKLGTFLENGARVDVVYTREEDVNLTTAQRADAVIGTDADLFISLHGGANPSPAAEGFELFHPMLTNEPASTVRRRGAWQEADAGRDRALQSREIARWLADGLAKELPVDLRGIRAAPLRVFKAVEVPVVLVELGCLTNAAEEALLATETYQAKLARGIANGLKTYLGSVGGAAQ